jgi:hypothetical protein
VPIVHFEGTGATATSKPPSQTSRATTSAKPGAAAVSAEKADRRIIEKANLNYAAVGSQASSFHSAMLMSHIDAVRNETGSDVSPDSLASWSTWLPNCEQALEALDSGWNDSPVLKDIPSQHRHRFIIDANKLQAFEGEAARAGLNVTGSPGAAFLFTEPGYLLGAANAHKLAFETPGRLDAAFINKVHGAISDANPNIARGMIQGEYASSVHESSFSHEAFSDIRLTCQELKARDGRSAVGFACIDFIESIYRIGSLAETDVDTKARIIDRWASDRDAALEKIGDAPSTAPLRAVAVLDFLAKCNRLHAYADGNGRMYQQILLNRALHDAKLPLCILPVPGNLHLNGLSEMLMQLRDGMGEAAKYVPCPLTIELQTLLNMPDKKAREFVREYRGNFAWNATGSYEAPCDSDDDTDSLGMPIDFTALP